MSVMTAIRRARRAGTPLMGVSTPDQYAVARVLRAAFETSTSPLWQWTCIAGVQPMNPIAESLSASINGETLQELTGAVETMPKLGSKAVMLVHNAPMFLDAAEPVQALAASRDVIKADTQSIILLAPSFDLPECLRHDVMLIDDPLPNDEQLQAITKRVCVAFKRSHDSARDSEWAMPSDGAQSAAAGSLRGLSSFEAEQAASIVLRNDETLDSRALTTHRDSLIQNTKGLTVDHYTETFADIRGIERARLFMRRLCAGPEKPRVILRIDEIDKKINASTGTQDSGATGSDELAVLLSSMEDYRWAGQIDYGHPGTAKSMLGKAVGPTFGIPSLELDIGATRSKFVGQSEQQIRDAIKTLHALGGDRVYVMATANELDNLPPELKRRFVDGVFFFDLPTLEERAALWELYQTVYSTSPFVEPIALAHRTPDWTGAEIRNACWMAHRLVDENGQHIPLEEAMLDTIPVAKGDPQSIENRRSRAHLRYRDAARPGHYDRNAQQTPRVTDRAFDMDDERSTIQ